MKLKYCFVLFLLVVGCSPSYHGKDIFGADEFVRDSYRIKESKNAILEMQGKETEDLAQDLLQEYKDTIQEDDVLTIILYYPKREDLMGAVKLISDSLGYKVSDGKITLPDLGALEVMGLTLDEAKAKIAGKYNEHFADAEVFLSYKNRILRKVELAGKVAIPNVPVDGKIRIFDVLSKAQIPADANLFKSYVIRDNKLLFVDLYRLIKEGDMSQNIVMRGGDKIYIAEQCSATLMVMGEVKQEGILDLPAGRISLREALARSGGILSSGDNSYIQVIRGSIVKPKIYILSWEHVINLPNDSLYLMPGDIVYVASKPIVEWNRFVSQLLPTFAGAEMIGRGVRGVGVVIP
jgi:polysaccharide export outer membrane protein